MRCAASSVSILWRAESGEENIEKEGAADGHKLTTGSDSMVCRSARGTAPGVFLEKVSAERNSSVRDDIC